MAIFCWLPPDNSPTNWSAPDAFTSSLTSHSPEAAACVASLTKPKRDTEPNRVSVRLSARLRLSSKPSSLRFSLSNPMPLAKRLAGVEWVASREKTLTLPLTKRSSPNTARSVSVRPAPTRPNTPRISPERNVRFTHLGLAKPATPLNSSTGSPAVRLVRGYISSIFRPTMSWIICSRLASTIAPLPTLCPSRSTV